MNQSYVNHFLGVFSKKKKHFEIDNLIKKKIHIIGGVKDKNLNEYLGNLNTIILLNFLSFFFSKKRTSFFSKI